MYEVERAEVLHRVRSVESRMSVGEVEDRVLAVSGRDSPVAPDGRTNAVKWPHAMGGEVLSPPTRPLLVEVPNSTLQGDGGAEEHGRRETAHLGDKGLGSVWREVLCDLEAHDEVK